MGIFWNKLSLRPIAIQWHHDVHNDQLNGRVLLQLVESHLPIVFVMISMHVMFLEQLGQLRRCFACSSSTSRRVLPCKAPVGILLMGVFISC